MYKIPNEADAFNVNQAELDTVDIDILVAAYDGTGIVSGGAVTAQVTPDMTVAVASGVAIIDGTRVTIGAGNVIVTAADGSNPRFDLVVVNSSAVKSVVAGTAAAEPVFPAIPANSIVLAAVYIPTSDTTIENNQITDKRVVVNNIITAGLGNTNTWLADQTYDDNIAVALGTGSDSRLYYDGTDTFWDLRAEGTGDLMIALAGSFPSPDSGTVHIWKGNAGTIAADSLSSLVIESDSSQFLQFLSPNTTQQGIRFGDPENNGAGQIRYVHTSTTDRFDVYTAGVVRLFYAAGAFAFQESTTISTSTGNLTLSPSGQTIIPDDNIFSWGSGGDIVSVLDATGRASDAAFSGVLVGTPVYDTAIPANSFIVSNITADGDLVFFTNTGGNSIEMLRVDGSTRQIVLPQSGDHDATPALAFGTGAEGIFSKHPGEFDFTVAGMFRYQVTAYLMGSIDTGGGTIVRASSTSTAPGLAFTGDTNTGIGRAAADQLSLIAGGVEGIRIIESGSAISGINLYGDLDFQQANPNIIGGDTNGILSITPDTATNQGGNIKLYGNTHATLAQDIEFYADSTLVLSWDESEENWDFASQNIKSAVLVAPALGTPASGVMTNVTGIPVTALANGTDGELITWNSSAAPATVAAGTATHVLTSNGAGAAPTFQEASTSFDNGLVIAGAVGIDYNPGSDIDTDIITVGVTGAPTVFWDESQSQFSSNVGLDITAGTITFDQVTHGVAGTTETIDWSAGQKHHLTLDENVTISFTAPPGACNLLVILEQDATATNTVTWPAAVEWPGGTEPTQSAGANEKDIYSFYYDGSIYHGVQTALFS